MITKMLNAFDKRSIKQWPNLGKSLDGFPTTSNWVDQNAELFFWNFFDP